MPSKSTPTPAPTLKFAYFDFVARGEPVRLCLHLGKIPFEDVRISPADWPAVKATAPYKQIPVLTIGESAYAQSNALSRYAARVAGLYPEDMIEGLRTDEILDVTTEIMNEVTSYIGKDAELVEKHVETMRTSTYPRLMEALEKRLDEWSTTWAVGKSMGLADLAVFSHVQFIKSGMLHTVPTDLVDGYERVMEIYKKVGAIPAVKEWYKKNPAGQA